MIMDVSKIRLWGENPRYTNYNKIDFQKIGIKDFERDELGYLKKDNYNSNRESYYLSLLKNKSYIENMLDLVESISQGFNPDIDEILVTRSALVNKFGDKIFKKKYEKDSIIYVLEGNRRLMAIHLLLNINDSRKLLYEKTKEYNINNIYKKFEEIFEGFKDSEISINYIDVKFYSTENVDSDIIWKTLNIRHFGKRKGKLNWPRGQVLNFIYQKINKFREQLGLKNGDEILRDDLVDDIKRELENFTGKVINDIDLQNALFVNWAIETFNKYNDQKILFYNTFDSNDEFKEDDEIQDQDNNLFSISSLELSMNQIKLLDKDGLLKSLKKIINLEIDFRSWTVNSKLDDKVLEVLILYIIKLIKLKKLNTRKFDENYSSTISEIIQLEKPTDIDINNEINRDVSKIKFSNVTLGMIMSIKNKYKNKIVNEIFKKIEFSSSEAFENKEKKIIEILYNITIPTLDKMFCKVSEAKEFLKKCNNYFEYTLVWLWKVEAISLIKNYNNNLIDELPIILFSAIIRITSELFKLWILVETAQKCKSHVDEEYIEYKNKKNYKQTNIKNESITTKLFKHLEEKNESYTDHINYFKDNNENHNDYNNERCDINLTYIIVNKIYENKNNKNILEIFFESINILKEENQKKLIKKYIKWILDSENKKIINKLMHEPHLIKKIRDYNYSIDKYEEFSNELKKYIEEINSFIDNIME